MQRWVQSILICLLLGATLNVALAWGFCLGNDPIKSSDTTWNSNYMEGVRDLESGKVSCMRMENSVLLIIDASWTQPNLSRDSVFDSIIRYKPEFDWMQQGSADLENTGEIYDLWIVAVGWPAFSMSFEVVDMFMLDFSTTEHGLILNHLPAWSNYDNSYKWPRTLPLGILYRGFIINTLFYATILWLLPTGFLALRRHRRIRRGKCGQCGYLIAVNAKVPGASPKCPECGTPIPGPPTRLRPLLRRNRETGILQKRPPSLRNILILILPGVILNVVIAWGCSFWAAHHVTDWHDPNHAHWPDWESARPIPQVAQDIHHRYLLEEFQDFNPVSYRSGGFSFGYDYYQLDDIEWHKENEKFVRGRSFSTTAHFAGWPIHLLSAYELGTLMPQGQSNVRNSFNLGGILVGDFLIPYFPVWWAFLCNTLFYTGFLWVLFFGSPTLRWWIGSRRIRQGLCWNCTYPMVVNSDAPTTSPHCTVCGAPILIEKKTSDPPIMPPTQDDPS